MKPRRIGDVAKNNSQGYKTWSNLFLDEAKQFCLNTALHGYRFIVLPKRILLERVVWAVICFISLVSALTLLCIAWFNFQENPVISVTDSTHHPIWNYEFPAVTVCNFNKISRKKAFQMARNFKIKNNRSTEDLAWDIRLLVQLINNDNPDIPAANYTRLNNLLEENQLSSDDALKTLAPTCDEMLVRCLWKGEERRCESMFQQVLTSEGFCCSFNYFAMRNQSFKGIFGNKAPKNPRRVSGCGYQTALEVLINNNPEDYFATHIPSIGYRVFVDNPRYFPNENLQNVLFDMKSTNLIGVNPKLTYSTKTISYLPIPDRRCVFSNEKSLTTNQHYNYHNCMVECKMNITMKYCGCLPIKYIHLEGTNHTICSLKHIPCLAEYQPLIESATLSVNFSSNSSKGRYNWGDNECKCMPDCEITDYTIEVSSGNLNRLHSISDITLFGDIQVANHSVIRVFYIDLIAIKIRWDVVFNWHTLLAYYGGLLGLFVGFSFVSGLEIIYFFVVRLLTDAMKNKHVQTEPAKQRKKRKMKIAVQPMYQQLDPSTLIIPSDAEIQRYKMNSYFFN